jgi:hypothetical protein
VREFDKRGSSLGHAPLPGVKSFTPSDQPLFRLIGRYQVLFLWAFLSHLGKVTLRHSTSVKYLLNFFGDNQVLNAKHGCA